MKLLQKLLRHAILFGIVTFIIGLMLAGYFRIKIHPYFTQLIEQYATDDYYPKLTEKQVLQLGWAHADSTAILFGNSPPINSYTRFSSKGKGITRIGCIGDSFTMGDELAAGLDFPSQLQNLLNQKADGSFEVINFGTSGYGLAQSAQLLSYIGKSYDIDILIVNLFEHLRLRDNTFKYHEYAPLHARFILNKDQELMFIPVLGKNRKDAIRQYYSFLTKEVYRKYDVKTPAFMKVFNQRFSEYGFAQHHNPFYYYLKQEGVLGNMLEHELELIYRLLLEQLCREYQNVVVLCNDPYSLRVSKSVIATNLDILEVKVGDYALANKALYRMPHFHFSATGAHEVAQAAAEHFLNAKEQRGFYDIGHIYQDTTTYLPTAFSDFDSIFIQIDNQKALRLYLNLQPPQPFGFTTPYSKEVAADCQSLLALNVSKSNDLSFVPLDFKPNDKLPLYLELSSRNGNRIQTQIGTLRKLNAFIWDMDISVREIEYEGIHVKFNDDGESLIHWELETTSPFQGATLILGSKKIPLLIVKENSPLLHGKFRYGLYFTEYAAFRSLDHFILSDVEKMSVKGNLLFQGATSTFSIPFTDFVWRSNEKDEEPL